MAAKKGKKSEETYVVFQEDSYFKGVLKFKMPLNIKGRFYGDIEGESVLLISRNSVVEANLNIKHLILEGKLTGNVVASDKVELRQGSSLTGNIKTLKLEISEGVVFDGQCEMQQEKQKTQG